MFITSESYGGRKIFPTFWGGEGNGGSRAQATLPAVILGLAQMQGQEAAVKWSAVGQWTGPWSVHIEFVCMYSPEYFDLGAVL